MAFTGVFPAYKIKFEIGIKGRESEKQDMATIAEVETFGIKIDGKTQDWTSMTESGWGNNLMTGKSVTFSIKGKRCVGDPGNDYIAATAWKDGLDCNSKVAITFPGGSKIEFDCVVDVKSIGGDDSTKVAPLECDLKSCGKPKISKVADSEVSESH